MNRKTTFRLPLLVLAISILLAACGGDDGGTPPQTTPTSNVVTMFASLDGAQETPAGTGSAARGFGMLTLNTTTNRVAGFIVHNVANASLAHVHGPAGRAATASPVVTMVQAGPGLWVTQDNATLLLPATVADFTNGQLYYNVHSPTFGAGEIRGQIDHKGTVRFASLDNTQETPAAASTARGFGILAFDSATGGVAGAIVHNVANANLAHVHGPAGRGATASPVVTMVQAGPGLWVTQDNATLLPPATAADFTNGQLYYNVHSTAFGAGEIRGQIDHGGTVRFASLDNTQETPAAASTARGFGILAFDSATGGVAGAIVHNVANANLAHVHGPAGRGATASPVVTLFQGGPDLWVAQDNATLLPPATAADFTNGQLYYNVHSTTFGAGEIRGQIDRP